ncbi:uncharacterized protein LOC126661342 [Mercurialis annua]|uniref:uncharacterized protein LOC126661342 n=1 Tax=Mercurialis annua TaxID=3986 RepID=UPI0024AF7EA5|nr:uncharacterized protein LOC126661342 [Mercurialis annua]
MTNWSELDCDLLSEIANRINCLRDFIIFGAVCSSWRLVALPENFKKSTRVPWLLLDRDRDDHSPRKFLNLSKDVIYGINLPKYNLPIYNLSNRFSIRSNIKENNYVYSSKGWFLNVDNHSQLYLLNPFSLSRINLPDSFKEIVKHRLLLNFALSSSPSVASDFMIMIIYYSHGTMNVGFWKNGDCQWTDVDLKLHTCDLDITYHNGRFYIVCDVESGAEYVVHEIDIHNSQFVSISSKFLNLYPSLLHLCNPYWIVGLSRELMIVTWGLDYESRDEDGDIKIIEDLYTHFEFIIQEIDFEKGSCKKVTNLGHEALFLGFNSSFLVDVSNESKFKSNHIYFAENFQQTYSFKSSVSVGVYSMMDGSYEPLFSEADSGYRCSSQWIEPRP